ncbi:MAG: polysaccharide deacetylase family protein [Patescibacteria group bacterium]
MKIVEHKIALPLLVMTLVLAILVTSAAGYFVYSNEESKKCEQILADIGIEMGLDSEYCEFSFRDVYTASSFEDSLQPKLSKVRSKQKEYNQRLIDYSESRKEYRVALGIRENLELLLEEQDKGLDIVVAEQDGIDTASLNMQNFVSASQLQVAQFRRNQKSEVQTLERKITEAENYNLDTTTYEKELRNLTIKKLDTTKQASEYKASLSSIPNIIELINQQLATVPEYFAKFNVSLPILMYHRIEDYEALPNRQKSRMRKELTTSPVAFATQLDHLQNKGYETVTLEDISQAITTEDLEFFQRKLVMLTFDDSYKEHYTVVFPELRNRDMKGVFGIVTGYSGIGWDALREMSQAGMEIVSHTVSHCALASGTKFEDPEQNPVGGDYIACSDRYGNPGKFMPTEEVKFELQESKKLLETELGKRIKYLTYPYGSYNTQTIEIAKSVGYTMALKVGGGPDINLLNKMNLGRVNVSGFAEPLGGWFATI